MKKPPFKGLVIRTAVVVKPGFGFIYACDPKKERKEIPHTLVFRLKEGAFTQGDCNYDAMSACRIEHPVEGIVDVAEAGYYSINSKAGPKTADIFETSQPAPKKKRARGIRSVTAIGGKAHAVGIRGMVYRLDRMMSWTRIDDGLPESFDAQAIDGFSASDLYAVGHGGQVWHYDGSRWRRRELPTNANLTAVKCAPDGVVYVAGHAAALFRGRVDEWEAIEHQDEIEEDIWDLEWFDGALYISTIDSVFRLRKKDFGPVNFGKDKPKSCYQLSATEDVMWSNGEFDVMSFDGKSWQRIV
jgi:hypothetical protein